MMTPMYFQGCSDVGKIKMKVIETSSSSWLCSDLTEVELTLSWLYRHWDRVMQKMLVMQFWDRFMPVVMCAWTFKNLECPVFVDLKGLEVFPSHCYSYMFLPVLMPLTSFGGHCPSQSHRSWNLNNWRKQLFPTPSFQFGYTRVQSCCSCDLLNR